MKKLLVLLLPLLLVSCAQKHQEAPDDQGPTAVDRVDALYNAFAEGDVEGVLAGMAEDVEWNEAEGFIYYGDGPYVGKDAVLNGVFARIGAEWEYWHLVDRTMSAMGDDGVLVTGRYQAKNNATGKMLDAQFAHVWKMRDSLVMSFQQYTDTKQAAEVVMADETSDEEANPE